MTRKYKRIQNFRNISWKSLKIYMEIYDNILLGVLLRYFLLFSAKSKKEEYNLNQRRNK